MLQALLVLSAVATTVGTVASINQQKKAASAQRQQQQLAAQRSQRQAIREAQLRRAQAQAVAQGAGAIGGSGLAGGLSSLSSQVGSGLGYSTQMSGLSQDISMANYRANLYGGIANIGGTVFSDQGGMPKLKEVIQS